MASPAASITAAPEVESHKARLGLRSASLDTTYTQFPHSFELILKRVSGATELGVIILVLALAKGHVDKPE